MRKRWMVLILLVLLTGCGDEESGTPFPESRPLRPGAPGLCWMQLHHREATAFTTHRIHPD